MCITQRSLKKSYYKLCMIQGWEFIRKSIQQIMHDSKMAIHQKRHVTNECAWHKGSDSLKSHVTNEYAWPKGSDS